MTDEDYYAWAEHHGAMFGMQEKWAETFVAWRKVFEAAGYTAAELRAATDAMAMRERPKFVSEHMALLTDRVRAGRAVAYRREVDQRERDPGVHQLCGGSGRVVVPHVRGIGDGQWVPIKVASGSQGTYYTMAVLCTCALGRWIGEHIPEERLRPMGLETYEITNPGWREQMQARHGERMARIEAAGVPEWVDADYRRFVRTLFKMPEEE